MFETFYLRDVEQKLNLEDAIERLSTTPTWVVVQALRISDRGPFLAEIADSKRSEAAPDLLVNRRHCPRMRNEGE